MNFPVLVFGDHWDNQIVYKMCNEQWFETYVWMIWASCNLLYSTSIDVKRPYYGANQSIRRFQVSFFVVIKYTPGFPWGLFTILCLVLSPFNLEHLCIPLILLVSLFIQHISNEVKWRHCNIRSNEDYVDINT